MEELTRKQKNKFAEKYGRWIKDNEIVIEDLPEPELMNIMDNLGYEGYEVEYWKAKGQTSGHLHIKNISGLEGLNKDEMAKYKELFIKKYILEMFYDDVDFQLCFKHRIAEENKIHFKYGTKKMLIRVINKNNKNFSEKDLVLKAKNKTVEEKRERILNINGSGVTAKIVEKISIIDLARRYGFKVRGNKAVCRFHNDKEPSLSFDDTRGYFFCFGCRKQGNIIDFLALCKQYKFKEEESNAIKTKKP